MKNVKNNYEGVAASYSRTAASVQQNKQGNDEQERGNEECAKRNNIILLPKHRYADVGKSGMKNNDELIKLMHTVESGVCGFSILILKSLDRLGRCDELRRKNIKFFLSRGITILSWKPNVCLTPDGNQSLSQVEPTKGFVQASDTRKSSPQQSEASLSDQLRTCIEFANSKGWKILDDCIYIDKANSDESKLEKADE